MTSQLAPRMKMVGASPTAEISNKVRSLSEAGHVVINLGEGELDFSTPEAIGEAGIAAIRDGDTKYTAVSGTKALKEAVCRKFERENHLVYQPKEIIVGAGAKQLIFNAFLATLCDGDEVIIPAPYWVSYPDMVRLGGGEPVVVSCSADEGWKLTPEKLEAAITDRTKWIVLNSPNNPTGAVYSKDELDALMAVVAKHESVLVLSDDIYEHVRFGGAFVTPAQVRPDLMGRVLTINGVSKGYSMTGWRIGYAGGPDWLISAMEVLQSQSTSNASTISQRATIAALDGGLGFLDDWMGILTERRRIVMEKLLGETALDADLPEGAFYVFADCKAYIGADVGDGKLIESDLDFATYLLEQAHVGVVHGSAFGMPGYIRIAYAVNTELLETACARIVAVCGKLTPAKAA